MHHTAFGVCSSVSSPLHHGVVGCFTLTSVLVAMKSGPSGRCTDWKEQPLRAALQRRAWGSWRTKSSPLGQLPWNPQPGSLLAMSSCRKATAKHSVSQSGQKVAPKSWVKAKSLEISTGREPPLEAWQHAVGCMNEIALRR